MEETELIKEIGIIEVSFNRFHWSEEEILNYGYKIMEIQENYIIARI